VSVRAVSYAYVCVYVCVYIYIYIYIKVTMTVHARKVGVAYHELKVVAAELNICSKNRCEIYRHVLQNIIV